MWYENFSKPEPSDILQVDGARPSSGKHYARKNDDATVEKKRYLGDVQTTDPLISDVASNYYGTKKVQKLLDKLANYMGEGFDKDEFMKSGDLGEKEPPKSRKRKKKETRNNSSLNQPYS